MGTIMKIALAIVTLAAASSLALAQEAFDVDQQPRLRVETNVGDFIIQLDRLRAPLTVDNFLQYVNEGHFNGLIFHRVVQGFVAQAGGYTPDLQPRPAERTVVNESGNGLSNLRGTLGMARTGDPHSGNSQFYINLADNSQSLNPRPSRWGYAVFGEVIEGMEVVDSIGHTATGAGGEFDRSVPVEPIIISRMVRITE
jgi:cyclophilin family peptidyl-prolyl cis-trans isomerase